MTREELLKTAKPILFNTDMVREILDGRKSVTRRKIDVDISNQFDVDVDGSVICYTDKNGDVRNPKNIARYKSGDILYVRETWKYHVDGYTGIDFGGYIYQADKEMIFKDQYNPWKPSIHMPKEAARIFLKVTDVRVERLQDITLNQLEKEGFEVCYTHEKSTLPSVDRIVSQVISETAANTFISVWDSTVKKKDLYGWDANPWVWVIEFERIEVE